MKAIALYNSSWIVCPFWSVAKSGENLTFRIVSRSSLGSSDGIKLSNVVAFSKVSKGEIVSSWADRNAWLSYVLVRAKMRKPSFGLMAKVDVTCKMFCSTRGKRNERRSDGVSSMFLNTSHKPCSAATVSGPFLNSNSPVSLQT